MEIDLKKIHETLQLLDDEKSDSLLTITYQRFFSICPDSEALWEKDDPISRGKMLNSIILTVMDNIVRPDICENNVISDVKDHDGYGVNKDMYGLFFSSLIAAFHEVLGEGFNTDMDKAWTHQLELLECKVHKYTCR